MSIPAGPPKDYTALAIICTSCIGLITGIIAIVQANKSKKLAAAGDAAGAAQAASTARILIIVTFAIAAVGLLINIIAITTGNFYYNFG